MQTQNNEFSSKGCATSRGLNQLNQNTTQDLNKKAEMKPPRASAQI
jgi:hypothetical protein